VRLASSAGTGFFYVKQRPRTSPKLELMKYDPLGAIVMQIWEWGMQRVNETCGGSAFGSKLKSEREIGRGRDREREKIERGRD
jgi:hypothetical protein